MNGKIVGILALALAFCMQSCFNIKKDNSSLSEDDRKIIERLDLFEKEATNVMTDSTILLGIELQCFEREYNRKIAELIRTEKLNKIGNACYYTFDFGNNIKAIGELAPVFKKGKLFKLDINVRWDNPESVLPISFLFSKLNDSFNSKYGHWENVMHIVNEYSIYERDWYGEGKHIALSSSNISYSCAKEEYEDYQEAIENTQKNKEEASKDI